MLDDLDGSIAGTVVLHERFDLSMAVGTALVLGGTGLVIRSHSR